MLSFTILLKLKPAQERAPRDGRLQPAFLKDSLPVEVPNGPGGLMIVLADSALGSGLVRKSNTNEMAQQHPVGHRYPLSGSEPKPTKTPRMHPGGTKRHPRVTLEASAATLEVKV